MKQVLVVFLLFLLPAPLWAQESADLVGHWRITAVNNPDDPWSGEVFISPTDDPDVFEAVLIAHEATGPGGNWRVEQSCQITVEGERIRVMSTITQFLDTPDDHDQRTFAPDNFSMRWRDEESLIGVRIDGFRDLWVVWTRFPDGLV